MKTIWIKLSIIASFVFAFIACDNMGETDSRLTAVSTLLEPTDGKAIKLEPTEGASIYFEWEYCKAEDSGTAIYQIAFDKTDGDFSSPVYLALADNNGYYNHVTISHKQMNKIAGMIGIKTSETGTFKWTAISSKGEKSMKSSQEHSITVTRLAGIEPPVDTYITGEGSEGGTDFAKASKMKAVESGVFEAYAKLNAGKPFYFSDGIQGNPRLFYTENKLIKEGSGGTTTVNTDGVYRVILDFNTGACSYSLVTKIGFYFCPDGAILFELPYVGNGIFQAKNQTVTFKQEGWGRDERYKFRMFVKENAGADAEKELEWATLNSTDSRPNASSPASYYYLKLLTNLTQWDNKWKLMGDFDGFPATYTMYLQADAPYTHSIVK